MKQIVRIFRMSRSMWPLYVGISVLTILLSLLTLLTPLITGWAIDEMQAGTEARIDYVVWLAVAIFALDFLQNVVSNWSGYIGDMVSARMYRLLSREYYQHLLHLPQSYFDNEQSGKIINRLNRSISQISNFMQMFSNTFLQFIFTTVFSLIVVAIISWRVAALLALLYPVYIFLTVRSSPKWQAYQKQKNERYDIASGRFAEVISQMKVVKNYTQQRRELEVFSQQFDQAVDVTRPQSRHWHIRDFQRRAALNIIFFGVFVMIFVQGAQGAISPGQAVALVLYAMQIRIPIFTISYLVESTQRMLSDTKDYFEILDIPQATVDESGKPTLSVRRGKVEFADVTFGYDDDAPVLRDISFTLKAGSKTALVGASGEGKTTIASLLLRLYSPQAGRILIDNTDIAEVQGESLQQHIATVFQEPALFSGTIRENIAYANPDATDEQVIAAAKAANADGFIRELEQGYDSEIGERGLKLSGGQKQRLAIARAVLKDAPILLLDEATSSLDSKSEAFVQEALERLMSQRTTLIIAHRLSTIQGVDTIITLKHGTIDEIGSPKALARSGGLYQTLLKLQTTTDPEKRRKALAEYDMIVK